VPRRHLLLLGVVSGSMNERRQHERRATGRPGERGYNLVILIMVLTVLNIMVAAALPLWSQVAKREKEEELIFRGLQYAEAIRIYQKRHGRPPMSLEELIEVKPRAIRQLWKDPMSESGEWGLLVQGGAPQANPGQPAPGGDRSRAGRRARAQRRGGGQAQGGQAQGESTNPAWQANMQRTQRSGQVVAIPPGGKDGRGRGRTVTSGPIVGVYSASSETALKSFADGETYDQWQFLVTLIPQPAMMPGDGRILRSRNDWIGRPFREGLQPVTTARPARGQELGGGAGPGGRRSPGGRSTARGGNPKQRR